MTASSRLTRLLVILFAFWALLATGIARWSLARLDEATGGELVAVGERWTSPRVVRADRRVLQRVGFSALPGWEEDEVAAALPALVRSCGVFGRQPPERAVAPAEVGGVVADWQAACRGVERLPAGDGAAFRAFLEERFQPWAVANWRRREGLFTGYYEPLLHGSRRRRGRFSVPLYRRPGDIVSVDLGKFREELRGQRVAGRLSGGELLPYHDREAIEGGALARRGLELLWVDDPVDAFFLHIQGSGRVQLAEGGSVRVGYAGQNGHAYTAIGRELIARGALAREEVSMQSIRAWLQAHPEEAAEVMRKNASYVFFRQLEGDGPLGSQGVVLTPGRSLAVDRSFLPLGAPVWLDGSMPSLDPEGADEPLRRLLVAQDTGGAIRGPVRGDVFWGFGPEAAERAGRMKHAGQLWLLLPRSVTPQTGGVAAEGKPGA